METADQVDLGLPLRQGALGDRGDDGKRVPDAVAQLGREHFLPFFSGNKARDVDKRCDDAVRHPRAIPVGVNARKVITASVRQANRSLDHLTQAEYRSQVVLQFRIDKAARYVPQRSSSVARYQVEQPGDSRREIANYEIAVEENSRDIGALKQIGEIAVCAIELVDFAGKLMVDGLKLFVNRKQFLVGGAELLVCGFELLDRRLQPLLSLLKFPFNLLNRTVLGRLGSAVVSVVGSLGAAIEKHDTVSDLVSFIDRLDGEADHLDAAVALYSDAVPDYLAAGLPGAMKCCTQVSAQPRARHGDDIPRGRSRRGLQIFPGARRKIQRFSALIDDDVGRGKTLDHRVCYFQQQARALQQVGLARLRNGRVLSHVRQELAKRHLRTGNQIATLEKTVFPVERPEQIGVSRDVLR